MISVCNIIVLSIFCFTSINAAISKPLSPFELTSQIPALTLVRSSHSLDTVAAPAITRNVPLLRGTLMAGRGDVTDAVMLGNDVAESGGPRRAVDEPIVARCVLELS